MRRPEQTKKILIVVRTYPVPVEMLVEASCTAGITDADEWMRLFPLRYRMLPQPQRFSKYQWIEVAVVKSPDDPRPESYVPIEKSIKILGPPLSTADAWKERKKYVYPLQSPSLCHLQRLCDETHAPTLGFFRPKAIEKLEIRESLEPEWTPKQLGILRQKSLFEPGPKQELEKIPFYFYYHFTCEDASCNGHKVSCADWEMGESYRKWREQYGDQWEEKFRQKYETEMIQKYDTHFFVGTMLAYPGTWIIIGLFYPPRRMETPTLFG